MKKLRSKLGIVVCLCLVQIGLMAKETIAIVNFDVIGSNYKEAQYLSMVTSEIRKLDTLVVVDKYTVAELTQSKVSAENKCFGVKCLSEIVLGLEVDYVLSGSAELTGEKLSIHLRLIDPKTAKVVDSDYSEYLHDGEYIWKFMEMSVKGLFSKKIRIDDKAVFDFDIAKNAELEGPRIKPYNLSGPRFGGSYVTGVNKEVLTSSEAGGFGKEAFMTVIGYQYEKSYLYTGAVQAVMQINFSLTGLDQQMAIPAASFLNGFRSSKYGIEVGFGPIFRFKKAALGAMVDGEWVLKSDASSFEGKFVRRLDDRGQYLLQAGWVWAVGKSFKAGNMNIPVNLYAIPDNNGWLFGLSMGYALHK